MKAIQSRGKGRRFKRYVPSIHERTEETLSSLGHALRFASPKTKIHIKAALAQAVAEYDAALSPAKKKEKTK